MKIKEVDEETITFDNEMKITYGYEQDCWEDNYADFFQLEKLAFDTKFDENLIFERVEGGGFRFGSKDTPMFFVPCYSDQNGYYSAYFDIYFNKKLVTGVCGELVEY